MTNKEIKNTILENAITKGIEFQFKNLKSDKEFSFYDENNNIGYTIYLWNDEHVTISNSNVKVTFASEDINVFTIRLDCIKIHFGNDNSIRLPIN